MRPALSQNASGRLYSEDITDHFFFSRRQDVLHPTTCLMNPSEALAAGIVNLRSFVVLRCASLPLI